MSREFGKRKSYETDLPCFNSSTFSGCLPCFRLQLQVPWQGQDFKLSGTGHCSSFLSFSCSSSSSYLRAISGLKLQCISTSNDPTFLASEFTTSKKPLKWSKAVLLSMVRLRHENDTFPWGICVYPTRQHPLPRSTAWSCRPCQADILRTMWLGNGSAYTNRYIILLQTFLTLQIAHLHLQNARSLFTPKLEYNRMRLSLPDHFIKFQCSHSDPHDAEYGLIFIDSRWKTPLIAYSLLLPIVLDKLI